MPNYVDYSTENMNGTPVHTFVDGNGQQSPPMYGDQANSLAANIDQYKQFQAANAGPDLRVTGPGGAPDDSAAPAPWTMPDGGAIPGNRTPAAPPVTSPTQQGGAAGPIGPPVAPGFADQQQAQAIHDAAASGNPIAGQQDPGAYVNRPVVTKGTTRAQLQDKARNSVAVPKTGEETVEGAAPYDGDAAQARADADIELRAAKQRQADEISARAQRDAAMWDQRAASAATRIQHEQQKQQLVEDGVNQDMATARDFRDQVSKQQVDPNRLFSGDRGAFNTIAAVIGQGLGAFAAAGGGSPTINGRRAAAGGTNYAKQIIDGAIDRDIRAQEVNIRTNNENANNQLNDIYKRVGDMNQAKTVLRQMQTDYAGMQMKALSARDGSQDAQNAFEQWDAANAADRAEQERKFQADSYGKHTVKIAQQFVAPGGGGARPPTEAEIRSRIETQSALAGLGNQGAKQQAEIDHMQSETEKNRAEAGKAKAGGDSGYNAQVEPVDTAISAADALAAKYGYNFDPRSGKYVEGSSSGAGFPRDVVPFVDSPTTANFKKELNNVNVLHSIATTGNKRANPETAEATGAKAGTFNDTTREQLENMRRDLSLKKSQLGAGTTSAARRGRAGQRVQVGVENNQAAADDDIQEE